jgi:tRNA1(Val) A37 N6-methylase TrmN6
VLNTAFENTLLTDETFSLVFLNPPYDGETSTGRGERMEFTFLNDSTKLLRRGGMLVYIIPETRVSEKIARHLAGW